MYFRAFVVALAALPMMALATPVLANRDEGGQCSVGETHCCDYIGEISAPPTIPGLPDLPTIPGVPDIPTIPGLPGLPANVPRLLGINCIPLSVGAKACVAQTVCCAGAVIPGLPSVLNCSPLNVNA